MSECCGRPAGWWLFPPPFFAACCVHQDRTSRLRTKVRARRTGATKLQALFRGHRLRKAIARCGGTANMILCAQYWTVGVDADTGEKYYYNTWTEETSDIEPVEMTVYKDWLVSSTDRVVTHVEYVPLHGWRFGFKNVWLVPLSLMKNLFSILIAHARF